MMNNILYIANFQKDHQVASSIIYSFINQEIPCSMIACFDTSIIKDIYYNYFISYMKYLKFYNTEESKIILHDSINKYQWFAILSKNCLYNKSYSTELSKLTSSSTKESIIVIPQNSQQIHDQTLLINTKLMIEHIRNNFSISDIYDLYIKADQTNTLYSFQSLNIEYPHYNNNTLHIDDYCIFGKFISNRTTELSDSMVYINKKNNKAYSIANNIIGNVIDLSKNYVSINWQINGLNNVLPIIKYFLNPISKCYTEIKTANLIE